MSGKMRGDILAGFIYAHRGKSPVAVMHVDDLRQGFGNQLLIVP